MGTAYPQCCEYCDVVASFEGTALGFYPRRRMKLVQWARP
ncbi:hypothetical protein X907_1576 [Glycocaulis alkaliphilus]|uniref:Uncharacterized protein n=1 Tax=Glycocaulis alkaliphilus TaxID=1434191 RepID=A0A3T0EAN6_9PROT|nr:hypothetical protein X907_1576 [Glycocaulis alkaliphilus]